ncbi:hypothetical protein ACHAXT_008341 [Thalassiosira profunda]
MSVDPSHYLPASRGGRPPLLKLQNISAKPELNGRFGQAVSFSAGRYVVALIDPATAAGNAQPTMLKLKPENLSEAGNIDQLKVGVTYMYHSARAYIAGPTVQGIGQSIVDRLPPNLQGRMTPNKALAGAAVVVQLILILTYRLLGSLFGFTKVLMLVSLVGVLLAVSSPDWVEGIKAKKPAQLIVQSAAKNFPRRWKENLVNMTGYTNISDRLALASLVLVLLFCGKTLLTPASRPPHMPTMPAGYYQQRMPRRPAPKYDLEHIYKLGYDDAKEGKDFGTSLPEDIAQYNAAQDDLPPQTQYDDVNYDWAPPPPPRKQSTFGVGTVMSILMLYRFGKDLVTAPDGSVVLDPQYIMAQIRAMEPWRLGMLGISLYRVVTALSSLV